MTAKPSQLLLRSSVVQGQGHEMEEPGVRSTHVGVLGTGLMGRQIATWFACRGYYVLSWDIQVIPSFEREVRKVAMLDARNHGLAKADALKAVQRIQVTDGLSEFGQCQVLFEAVKEDLKIKRDLIAELGRLTKPQPIIASNTSSLLISELAEAACDPSRVIGVHFFNPVVATDVVELIPGKRTAQETVTAVHDLLTRVGKSTLRVPDLPGFAVNRLLFSMINEALLLLETGEVEAETIDQGLRAGAKLAMGPLEMADFIGLDVCLAILENLYAKTGDAKWRPPAMLRDLVARGALGKKTRWGIYRRTSPE